VEKRISRINNSKKKSPEQQDELKVLTKILVHLEDGKPFHQIELTTEEQKLLQAYTFLTDKPLILVVNVDENQLAADAYPAKAELESFAADRGMPLLVMSAKIESEIAVLDKEDCLEFMQELGITEPGMAKLAQKMYSLLKLISFFTVGKDEVRAWTITQGLTAQQAAGKIHSDLERGFIRAETIGYEDFIKYGSIAAAKEHGVWRLEGRNYIVQDGDIISVRFNV